MEVFSLFCFFLGSLFLPVCTLHSQISFLMGCFCICFPIQFNSVQLLSHVRLFATPGKEQAAGVWETCLEPGWPQLRSGLPFGPRSQASLQKAQGPGVCKLPKPPASRALCQAKRAPRAALPSGCSAAQTKRWAEGIRVPAPLAGRGSTTARGILRLCPASACQTAGTEEWLDTQDLPGEGNDNTVQY